MDNLKLNFTCKRINRDYGGASCDNGLSNLISTPWKSALVGVKCCLWNSLLVAISLDAEA
jgi:hypothetical protein